MHSSLLFLIVTVAFTFLIVRVTHIPAVFPGLEPEPDQQQDGDDGNLFSSFSNILFNDPSPIYAGTETATEEQSSGPVAIASANDLLLQCMPGDPTGTGISINTDLLWDTSTDMGGEEQAKSLRQN